MEKELANLGGSCAAALMKKDLALPIGKSYSTYFAISSLFQGFCINAVCPNVAFNSKWSYTIDSQTELINQNNKIMLFSD